MHLLRQCYCFSICKLSWSVTGKEFSIIWWRCMQDSLYCSEECLRADALNKHPLLGYDWQELRDFPRSVPHLTSSPGLSSSSSQASSPSLSPIPSYTLPSPGLKYHRSSYRLSPPMLELEPTKRPSISKQGSNNKPSLTIPKPQPAVSSSSTTKYHLPALPTPNASYQSSIFFN